MNRPWRSVGSLALVAWLVAATVGTHGIGYWDAGDYVRLACDGGPSGLLLGRPAFLAIARALVDLGCALGVRADGIEPMLRWSFSAIGAMAAPMLALVAEGAGIERRTAWFAGLVLALSPTFTHVDHQVLTDAPALAVAYAALALCQRARGGFAIAAAGAGFGVAIGMRETAAVPMLSGLWLLGVRRAPIAVASATAALLALLFGSHGPHLAAWFRAMHRSSAHAPLMWRDVATALGFAFALAPLAWLFAWRGRAMLADRRVAAIVLPAAVATVLLLAYPDGAFSPRYFVAVAPPAVALLAAPALARLDRRLLACGFALPLVAAFFASRRADQLAREGARRASIVASASPPPALVIPGHACPIVGATLAARDRTARARRAASVVDARPRMLCPGWDWPSEPGTLASMIDEACARGPVLLDRSGDGWVGAREAAIPGQLASITARYAARDDGPLTWICLPSR